MLADGVVEKCELACNAPTVLEPKKDRKLNAVTIPDSYPLPRIEDLLQMEEKTKFMSSIDRSGY